MFSLEALDHGLELLVLLLIVGGLLDLHLIGHIEFVPFFLKDLPVGQQIPGVHNVLVFQAEDVPLQSRNLIFNSRFLIHDLLDGSLLLHFLDLFDLVQVVRDDLHVVLHLLLDYLGAVGGFGLVFLGTGALKQNDIDQLPVFQQPSHQQLVLLYQLLLGHLFVFAGVSQIPHWDELVRVFLSFAVVEIE